MPTGVAPVGLAVSPNGDWLYSTSELTSMRALRKVAHRSPRTLMLGGMGTLAVVSVPKAEADPARATVSTVAAGCSPVRVITSANGGMVWATARGSDSALEPDVRALLVTDFASRQLETVNVTNLP